MKDNIKQAWRVVRFALVQTAALTRWLKQTFLGTVWGVFVVALALYFWVAPYLFAIRPLTFGELVIWFSELSEGGQVAAGAALLTAVGLVAAYWTAMSVWKRQKFIELRIAAGTDIQAHCQSAMRISYDLGAYLSTLLDTIERVRAAKNEDDARFLLYYSNGQATEFQRRVQALHEARMELKGLFSVHGGIIVGVWGVWKHLELFIGIIDEFWAACSAFSPPSGDFDARNFLATFLSRYNETQVRMAYAAYDKVLAGSAMSGFVHGSLTHGAMPLTLATVFSLFKHRKFMLPAYNVVAEADPSAMND